MRMKNQLSSFDISVLIQELSKTLIGGFINKIYQPNKDEIQIRITLPTTDELMSKYQQFNLQIKLGKYLYVIPKSKTSHYLESSNKPQSKQPRPFPMLLRKHLKNGRIVNIYQHEFDRIIIFEIEKKEKFQLVIELFGEGNIILVKDDIIIQPLFTQSWSYRTLRAGEQFKFPPVRVNPLKLSKEEFCNLLSESKKDLVRTLIMDIQIPGIYAEELCHRRGLDKNIKTNSVSQKDCIKLFNEMGSIISEVKLKPKSLMIFEDEKLSKLLDFVPIKLELYNDYYVKELTDINLAIQQYFEPTWEIPSSVEEIIPKTKEQQEISDRISTERARLLRKLEQQKSAILKFSDEITYYHKLGEAIYTNYLRTEELLNEIKELRNKVPPDEIFEQLSKSDDISELNPHEGYVRLNILEDKTDEKLSIKLDIRKNVMQNANNYYELSKHSKEKLHGAQKALNITKGQLAKLDVKAKSQKKQEPKRRIMKHFWFEKYHWFITTEGNIVVGGRDAKSNDQVVKKHLKDKDRYAHADISGAASIVIKYNPDEENISETSLKEACQFAVIYSKAWSSKVGAGIAYWVKPDQVSKTPQSGEFLAKGAFVIRGRRNHVGNIKLQLAVGEIDYKGHYKLMSGPLEAIKTHSTKYILLVPGDIKKNVMANELAKLFNVAVDDILSILPSGEFTIVDKVGFK